MSHLKSEELVDLAEGTREESAFPHLRSCDRCRRQLTKLRAAFATLNPADDVVPEPSPLFWDHLSARVHHAILAEGASEPAGWSERLLTWKIAMPLAACIAALIAVTVMFRPTGPASSPLGASAVEQAAPTAADGSLVPDAMATDDPSWSLMTDLAGDLDWDAAAEAGLIGPAGGVDRAVFDLTLDERRELERLLKEELARSGA